jgi:ferric-dicitrate binding protein FerR (iron transport regulator)
MMEPDLAGEDLDERLRRLGRSDSAAIERVATGALGGRRRHPARRWVAAAAATAAVVVAAAVGVWHRPSVSDAPLSDAASRVVPSGSDEGPAVVLVEAPDGSSLIFSAATAGNEVPPGTGVVSVEE